jgi:hypothetical protein
MNYLTNTLTPSLNSDIFKTSFYQNEFKKVSENNRKQINTIKSFSLLQQNWDSYGANIPSEIAITKAITFVKYLSDKDIDVYFTIPTPDGDIAIEIRNGRSQLEFVFSRIESEDKIIASNHDEFSSEAPINDTTLTSYLKWLIWPDGECPNF